MIDVAHVAAAFRFVHVVRGHEQRDATPESSNSRSQSCRRATGSMPAVGSSRNNTSGSWIRAQAKRQPLFPAAGQVCRPAVDAIFKRRQFQHFVVRCVPAVPAIEPVDAAVEVEVLADRQIGVEAESLRHVADAAFDLLRVVRTSKPNTVGVARRRAAARRSSMRMMVDLPLPLGPSRPKISPRVRLER